MEYVGWETTFFSGSELLSRAFAIGSRELFFSNFSQNFVFGDEDLWWFLEGNMGRWVPIHMKRQHAKAAYQACWGISAGRMMDKSARNMDVCSKMFKLEATNIWEISSGLF